MLELEMPTLRIPKPPAPGPLTRRLATVKQTAKLPGYEWLTESSLRHLINESKDRVGSKGDTIPGNGLAPAIIRIGRKVVIDLDLFDEWVESHRGRR